MELVYKSGIYCTDSAASDGPIFQQGKTKLKLQWSYFLIRPISSVVQVRLTKLDPFYLARAYSLFSETDNYSGYVSVYPFYPKVLNNYYHLSAYRMPDTKACYFTRHSILLENSPCSKNMQD